MAGLLVTWLLFIWVVLLVGCLVGLMLAWLSFCNIVNCCCCRCCCFVLFYLTRLVVSSLFIFVGFDSWRDWSLFGQVLLHFCIVVGWSFFGWLLLVV